MNSPPSEGILKLEQTLDLSIAGTGRGGSPLHLLPSTLNRVILEQAEATQCSNIIETKEEIPRLGWSGEHEVKRDL